jgi:hypothetical protein
MTLCNVCKGMGSVADEKREGNSLRCNECNGTGIGAAGYGITCFTGECATRASRLQGDVDGVASTNQEQKNKDKE